MVVDLYFTDCWWSARDFGPAAQASPNPLIKNYINLLYFNILLNLSRKYNSLKKSQPYRKKIIRQPLLCRVSKFHNFFWPSVSSWGGFFAQQSVTKITFVTIMNLVTPKAGAKHELLFNKPASGLTHKHLIRLERPARFKRSSLLGLFIGYDKNKVTWILPKLSR